MTDYAEDRKRKHEEVELALNVDGYHGFLNFDDDIFLMDSWYYEDAMNYLVGVKEALEISDGSENFKRITTLDHDFYFDIDQPHITLAFNSLVIRLHKLWDSGLHDKYNSPKYYIDWALSKKHKIPWLEYAIEKGFYQPKPDEKTVKAEKPLTNKERETLLVIIAALANEAKIDISKISKAGEQVAKLTQELAAPIGATTIENHLKQIPDALEKREK